MIMMMMMTTIVMMMTMMMQTFVAPPQITLKQHYAQCAYNEERLHNKQKQNKQNSIIERTHQGCHLVHRGKQEMSLSLGRGGGFLGPF